MNEDIETKKRELALKAANYLKEYGWIQGRLGDRGGPACLWGALNAAVDKVKGPGYSHRLADDVGEDLTTRGYVPTYEDGFQNWNAAYWNDRPGRTKDEVIQVLLAYGRGEAPAHK